MPSEVGLILRKLESERRSITELYNKDFALQNLSADLIYNIGRYVENCQRALDWTATDLDHAFGNASDRSPYFPLQKTLRLFQQAMNRDFRSVPKPIYDLIESRQPYNPGYEVLGFLKDLTRVSKHQDFVKVTRLEHRQRSAGGVTWNPASVQFGPGVRIGGKAVDPSSQLPAGIPVTETVFVGWRFREHEADVLPTLERLGYLVTDVVQAIRHQAGW